MNKKFTAVTNMFFSSSQSVFTIITGLVMVPIYLRYFSMSTYGAWLASGNVISMLALIEPGIGIVATQKLSTSYGSQDKRMFSEIFGSSLVLSLTFCFMIITLGMTLSVFIPTWLKVPAEQHQAFRLALCFSSVGSGTSGIFYLLGAVPQAWQRTMVPGITGFLALSANIITILIALKANMGIVALGLGSMALSLVYILGYVIYISALWLKLDFPKLTVSMHTCRELWCESKMLLMAKFSGAIGKYLEAPVAALVVSNEAAAVLVLTGRILNAVQMFADRIGSAVFAGVAHESVATIKNGDFRVVREIIVASTIVSGFGIGFSLAFSEQIITLWVGKNAFGGTSMLVLLAVSAFITSRKDLFASLLIALGQIKNAARWLAIESIARVMCLLVFVILFKVLGIPLAGAMASFVILLGLNHLLLKTYLVDKELLYMPGIVGCAISLFLGVVNMHSVPVVASWFELGCYALLFAVIVLVSNLLDRGWVSVLRKTIDATYIGLKLGKTTK